MKKQVDSMKYSYAKSDLFKDLQENTFTFIVLV